MSWLRNAFALEEAEGMEPTPRQREIADRICREIYRRRMAPVAHLFLEMVRPMNFLGAQVLHFFEPFIGLVTDAGGYREFSRFLEHRGAVEYLTRRLAEVETEAGRGAGTGAEHRAKDGTGSYVSSRGGDGTDQSR